MTDDLPFDYPSPATPTGAVGRTCRRHNFGTRWGHYIDGEGRRVCSRCGALWRPEAARRGRSSLRAGKDAERAVAAAYGGERVGQYGGPVDVTAGLFVIQSKAGRGWYRQTYVDELDKLPRTGGRVPTLVVSDRPGQGRRTRRYVVRLLEDDIDLHGDGAA